VLLFLTSGFLGEKEGLRLLLLRGRRPRAGPSLLYLLLEAVVAHARHVPVDDPLSAGNFIPVDLVFDISIVKRLDEGGRKIKFKERQDCLYHLGVIRQSYIWVQFSWFNVVVIILRVRLLPRYQHTRFYSVMFTRSV
jgi:hypothetical protein